MGAQGEWCDLTVRGGGARGGTPAVANSHERTSTAPPIEERTEARHAGRDPRRHADELRDVRGEQRHDLRQSQASSGPP